MKYTRQQLTILDYLHRARYYLKADFYPVNTSQVGVKLDNGRRHTLSLGPRGDILEGDRIIAEAITDADVEAAGVVMPLDWTTKEEL